MPSLFKTYAELRKIIVSEILDGDRIIAVPLMQLNRFDRMLISCLLKESWYRQTRAASAELPAIFEIEEEAAA